MRGSFGWASVTVGAVAGLLLMVVAGLLGTFLLWLAERIGWDSGDPAGWAVLSLALLVGEFTGGYVAGRLGKPAFARLNGSLAALGLYAVFATLSLVSGSPASPLTLVMFAVVAAALGLGGGIVGGKKA